MKFWDRFVLWVYLSMADWSVPRTIAGRIFEQALNNGHLEPEALNDLSVLLLLTNAPPKTALWQAAEAEVSTRSLPAAPLAVGKVLRAVTPPRLTELLEVGRAPVPDLRALVLDALIEQGAGDVLANLCCFRSRLFLEDPEAQLPWAVGQIDQALIIYYGLPFDQFDFPSVLYRQVLAEILANLSSLPWRWPTDSPLDWIGQMPYEERRVIDNGLRLWPLNTALLFRLLLAFQMYARLNVEQIAAVLRLRNPAYTCDQIAQRLEQCWNGML